MRCTQCAAATPMISCGGLCWVRLWLSSGSYRDIHLCVCVSYVGAGFFFGFFMLFCVRHWWRAARWALHNCFMFHVCAGGTAVCSAHAEAWYRGRCIVQCGIHDNAAAASSERVTTQHVTFRYHLRFA